MTRGQMTAPPAARRRQERREQERRGRLRAFVAGLGDSCALAAVALRGCVAVVAVGTAGSLLWALVVER